MNNITEQKNTNPLTIKDRLVQLISENEIEKAMAMFEDHSEEVDIAIEEYNTKTHSIMERADKVRNDKTDYITNKLPRNWQQYINEVALFFFLGNPIKWELSSVNGDEYKEAFNAFLSFLDEIYYNDNNRRAKRIAGAETECAKLYATYNDGNGQKTKIVLLSKSNGYELRPLFNRYGDLKAFGVGYYMNDEEGNAVYHFDIYTDDFIYECSQVDSWSVSKKPNKLKKIPIIYIKQPKEWEGVEERIVRDEWLDSKSADITEYFADPYLKIQNTLLNRRLANPEEVGKVIEVTGKDDVFEYVTPPSNNEMKSNEKSILKESILQGTFTPDFSYENMKGMGSLSGEALRRANILGYIKRQNRMDIYMELIARERNLILAIMEEYYYPEYRKALRDIKIDFDFQDPFIGGLEDNSEEISRLLESGAMSLETAVEMNRNVSNKAIEVQRIKEERNMSNEKQEV